MAQLPQNSFDAKGSILLSHSGSGYHTRSLITLQDCRGRAEHQVQDHCASVEDGPTHADLASTYLHLDSQHQQLAGAICTQQDGLLGPVYRQVIYKGREECV